ncbi:MAG: hypothetical protein GXO58_05540 [Thermodesulfobacteria bacterium]|nr:hypothetical protein [Thermodesulfobacteriota bacterium]
MAVIGFDTTVFPRLNYKDPAAFWGEIENLKAFFRDNRQALEPVFKRAPAFLAAFQKLDPLIQSYTAKVCPYCGTVCCANKFGFPEYADVVGFLALGLEIPNYNLNVNEEDICQFIGDKGCVLPRPQRPYRCTWYFCDPLLVQLEIGPARDYRNFIKDLQELSRARGELLENFYQIWKGLDKTSK